jgi:hypothetical protein
MSRAVRNCQNKIKLKFFCTAYLASAPAATIAAYTTQVTSLPTAITNNSVAFFFGCLVPSNDATSLS